MPPTDAIDLINAIPRQGYVEMRGGYESHSTGVGSGDVDLVVEFYDGLNRHLIAASSTNIYNSTAVGAATSLGTGFTNGTWDTAMMNGVMGFVNGADAPQKYDGSTLSAMTISGAGLTTTNIIGLHVHKNRSYFWEDDSQSFWYSNVNTLGGACTKFELGQIAVRGGKLLNMSSWTVDGGSGPDDFAVFIMSTGEVIVYQGSDPGSSTDWALVGIYTVSEPVAQRAIMRFGREIAMIAEDDTLTLPSAFGDPSPPVTKLSGAISDAVANYGTNPGWQMMHYPNASLVIINVPVALSPDAFEQYVLNTQTFAACRFTDIPARCWGMYNGQAYFGSTDGVVYRFDTVEADDGSDIDVTIETGWSDMGSPNEKQITAASATFNAAGTLNYDLKFGFDFISATPSSPSSSVSAGTPWGSAWGSSWGPLLASEVQSGWKAKNGRGSVVNQAMSFSRQGDRPKWYKTDALVKLEGMM